MPAHPQYVYGVLSRDDDLQFHLSSLEPGIAWERIDAVSYRDVAAIISEYPSLEIKPLRQNLASHHHLIRSVMRWQTVVPVTFGHISESKAAVLDLLKQNYAAIRAELGRLDGKIEMGIKVLWDVDNIFQHFVKNHRDLAQFRDHIFGRSSPPSQAEKIELGRLFDRKVSAEREQHAKTVFDVMGGVAAESRQLPPVDEKMVLNAAFLIERQKEQAFEEAVHLAARQFDSNFTFDYNGPWAPYNFVELVLELAAQAEA